MPPLQNGEEFGIKWHLLPALSANQKDRIRRIVEYLIAGYGDEASGLPEPMSSYFEQLLNALIYELFFESEMHAEKLFFFQYLEKANHPDLTSHPRSQYREVLENFYNVISNLKHPIRATETSALRWNS